MSNALEFAVETRTQCGTAASRRQRHAGKVPAIIYGSDKDPLAILLDHKTLMKALAHENITSQILTLKMETQTQKVVIKKMQHHHTKPRIVHIDFLRVKATTQITMPIPLQFTGEEECPGVKEGGIVSKLITEIEVKCLPQHLPESITLDIAALNLDQSLHLSDLKLPDKVEFAHIAELDEEHNLPVVSIHLPKVSQEDIEADAAEAALAEEAAAEAEGSEATAADQGDDASAASDKDSEAAAPAEESNT